MVDVRKLTAAQLIVDQRLVLRRRDRRLLRRLQARGCHVTDKPDAGARQRRSAAGRARPRGAQAFPPVVTSVDREGDDVSPPSSQGVWYSSPLAKLWFALILRWSRGQHLNTRRWCMRWRTLGIPTGTISWALTPQRAVTCADLHRKQLSSDRTAYTLTWSASYTVVVRRYGTMPRSHNHTHTQQPAQSCNCSYIYIAPTGPSVGGRGRGRARATPRGSEPPAPWETSIDVRSPPSFVTRASILAGHTPASAACRALLGPQSMAQSAAARERTTAGEPALDPPAGPEGRQLNVGGEPPSHAPSAAAGSGALGSGKVG